MATLISSSIPFRMITMAKARLEIGVEEKHIIEVDSHGFPERVRVLVDGRELSSETILGQSLTRESDHRLGLKVHSIITKELQFSVGDRETHSVTVQLVKEGFGIKIELYVDGNLESTA